MGVANGNLRVVPILPPSSNENAILEGARDAQGRLNGHPNRSSIRLCSASEANAQGRGIDPDPLIQHSARKLIE